MGLFYDKIFLCSFRVNTHLDSKPVGGNMKSKLNSQDEQEINPDGKPRIAFKLQGVRSGDPLIPRQLLPNRNGQREVIVLSLQKTIHGPGIAHVCLSNNPMGRSYPISATYLPEEAFKLFRT